MKMNNSNDARNSLLDTISKLKSGRATNLDEVALEIKAFAVLNGLQDRHHEECRINGKTSQKQIVKVGRKLDTALGGDKRLKRVKTTIGNLRAKLSRLEDQLAKTKQSRQTV